jgi:phosphoglycolate phosphatase
VPYRLFIFDFDGTLADSFPAFPGYVRQAVEHFKLRPIDDQTLDDLRGKGAREIIKMLGIPAWKVPLVARFMRQLMTTGAAETQLFPGVPELLRTLTENECVIAIVSSNSEPTIRAILGSENAALVRVYACGASLFGKAAKFRQVLKRTGFPASETLTIGDEIRDLEAARECGIDFGAVSWGYTKVEALRDCSPAQVFQRPEEIAERLLASGTR